MIRRALLLILALCMIAVTAYGIAIAQSDEQLIADFLKARGFNFPPPQQTALSRAWLSDMDRLRPTMAFVVTQAAPTATPTSGIPPDRQEAGIPRRCGQPMGEEKTVFSTDDTIDVLFYGGSGGDNVRLVIRPPVAPYNGMRATTMPDQQWGGMYQVTMRGLREGTFGVDCYFDDLDIEGGFDIVVQAPLPTTTPVPPNATPPPRECGHPRLPLGSFSRTIFSQGSRVSVYFYGGMPGEKVMAYIGAPYNQMQEAVTEAHPFSGAFQAISFEMTQPGSYEIECAFPETDIFVAGGRFVTIRR